MPEELHVRLVDTHIHLASSKYTDLSGLISRAKSCGVIAVIATGTGPDVNENIMVLRTRFKHFIHCAIGLHPESPNYLSKDHVSTVIQSISKWRHRIVAIGEVGLPYYSIRDSQRFEHEIEKATSSLKAFLFLAEKEKLPVILHAPHRSAEKALQLLRDCNIEKAVFHWHKSPLETTKKIVDNGFYISVTPEIVYEERDRRLVENVPLSNLLLETDGPWSYENEFSGKLTESHFVKRVAEEIAKLKDVSLFDVAEETTNNAVRLFGFSI
jgi:TatD DNase family protein